MRFVAGADEAGRGSLAGPLVVAGVLLDYDALRGHCVRPLAPLNDSKQVAHDERERSSTRLSAVRAQISVRVVSAREIDRSGLHRSNLAGAARRARATCILRRRRASSTASGSGRPRRRTARSSTATAQSAAIAAASIVAKVVRDRVMRRLDALYPRYGFMSHVGYITPGAFGGRARLRAVRPSTAARSRLAATKRAA